MKKNVIKLTQAQLREKIQNIILEQSSNKFIRVTSPTGQDFYGDNPDYVPDEEDKPKEEPVTQFSYNKPNYARVYFNNGGDVSIQASRTHYSHPRDNFGPYTEMELGYPSRDTQIPESMLRYIDPLNEDEEGKPDPYDNVYGYVPVSVIKELIELNGGVKSGEVPPMAEEEDSMGREDDLNEQGSDTYNKLMAERDRLKKEIARLEMEIGKAKESQMVKDKKQTPGNRPHDKMVMECLKKDGFKVGNTSGKYDLYMFKDLKIQGSKITYVVFSQRDPSTFATNTMTDGTSTSSGSFRIGTTTTCDYIRSVANGND